MDHGGDNGHGNGNGNGNGPSGDGPPGHVNQHVNQHVNAHDSFNTNINNSFNTSINNVTVNQFFTVAATPQAQLQQTFQSNLLQAAQQQSLATLLNLVTAEAQLATDTFFVFSGAGLFNPGLVNQMHDLQFAIQDNPLEGTEAGESVGFLTFDLVLQAYVSAHVGVGGQP
jgi:hypothetical protein